MTDTLKAITAALLGLEPHQIGLIFMSISGVLVLTVPIDWIKRR